MPDVEPTGSTHSTNGESRPGVAQTYRILIAVHPDAAERVHRILDGHDLRVVKSIDAAKASLDADEIDLIFLGARFDESRMFEFLEYARERHRTVPLAACILAPTTMRQATIDGLSHTAKLYGARVFVNLNESPDEPVENKRVRLMLEELAAP
jgi:hypothetical protein